MPIVSSSRYAGVKVYEVVDNTGERHPTLELRPPTPPAQRDLGYRHLVTGVEDMEYLAWRFYGDSRQWWRIAEANALRFPLDLVPGMSLAIPNATDIGRVVRDRRF
jgi:hypothetical protein